MILTYLKITCSFRRGQKVIATVIDNTLMQNGFHAMLVSVQVRLMQGNGWRPLQQVFLQAGVDALPVTEPTLLKN